MKLLQYLYKRQRPSIADVVPVDVRANRGRLVAHPAEDRVAGRAEEVVAGDGHRHAALHVDVAGADGGRPALRRLNTLIPIPKFQKKIHKGIRHL